jgi:hypothetical protein
VLGTVLATLAGLAQTRSQSKIDLKWVYISGELNWVAPPKDPELPKYEVASARILVFYPSGEFADTSFWVGRYKKGPIFIIPGEGFGVRKGNWVRDGDLVVVQGRLVNSEGLGVYHPPRSYDIKETWRAEGTCKGRLCARLVSPSQIYVPLRAMENLKRFEAIINEPERPQPGAHARP